MIYKATDLWSSPNSYLEHHGVKGMKWGVRHDDRPLGQRYSEWGRKTSNRSYDKMEARAKKRLDNGKITKTAYNKRIAKVEARRQKRMSEYDSFDKMRSRMAGDPNVAAAKKEYKAQNKVYKKAFNKYYYSNPLNVFTDKGRQKNERLFMNAMIAANDVNIAKGKLIQAKGIAKNKPKTVAKGKRLVANATNAKKYNVKVASVMDQGYRAKDAYNRTQAEYNAAMRRQIDNDAAYRKSRYSSNSLFTPAYKNGHEVY